MNRNAIGWVLFLICCAAQLAVPASMILRHERTLGSERVYLFRCAPVNPVDAFRGRYVALSFEQSRFEGRVAEALVPGSTAYATLDADDEGFASIVAVDETAPQDTDYLEVRIRRRSEREAWLELPFDRYYMDESLAPEAERAYRDRSGSREAWVTVHVRDGHAALEELYLDGLPIREFLEQD
jgi:uncharacterized membrane-anchored protein